VTHVPSKCPGLKAFEYWGPKAIECWGLRASSTVRVPAQAAAVELWYRSPKRCPAPRRRHRVMLSNDRRSRESAAVIPGENCRSLSPRRPMMLDSRSPTALNPAMRFARAAARRARALVLCQNLSRCPAITSCSRRMGPSSARGCASATAGPTTVSNASKAPERIHNIVIFHMCRVKTTTQRCQTSGNEDGWGVRLGPPATPDPIIGPAPSKSSDKLSYSSVTCRYEVVMKIEVQDATGLEEVSITDDIKQLKADILLRMVQADIPGNIAAGVLLDMFVQCLVRDGVSRPVAREMLESHLDVWSIPEKGRQ